MGLSRALRITSKRGPVGWMESRTVWGTKDNVLKGSGWLDVEWVPHCPGWLDPGWTPMWLAYEK